MPSESWSTQSRRSRRLPTRSKRDGARRTRRVATKNRSRPLARSEARRHLLGEAFSKASHSQEELELLLPLFAEDVGEILFAWCEASTWCRDAKIAEYLQAALKQDRFKDRVAAVARARVVEGPLLDAIACAPLLGEDRRSSCRKIRGARAPGILFGKPSWAHGGAGARPMDLGFASDVRRAWCEVRARSASRSRARRAMSRDQRRGMPARLPTTSPWRDAAGAAPLLLHPEPLVWVHASRALGRLTGPMEQVEGTVLDWCGRVEVCDSAR